MWVWVTRILGGLVGISTSVLSQIKAAWLQARAIVLALGLLAVKQWGARMAWRIAIAAIFISLMVAATRGILGYAIPEMESILSAFAGTNVVSQHEGVFYMFWDAGLNLKACFGCLRTAVSALITAWTCRRLWSLFLVKRLINPPM